jgi:hypothetical protein
LLTRDHPGDAVTPIVRMSSAFVTIEVLFAVVKPVAFAWIEPPMGDGPPGKIPQEWYHFRR